MEEEDKGTGSKIIHQASSTYCSNYELSEFTLAPDMQLPLAPLAADSPREWNAVIREFLSIAGLTQTVRGFDADMVVMNPSFERDVIPGALDDLLDSLVVS